MRTLKSILDPKSIAVIGGGAWCEAVIEQNLKMGFEGAIWPVHPKKATVGGLPAFASVSDLPAPPDATFIGVNRNATIDLVADLNAMGAGGAVCFASGFKETEDGQILHTKLLDAAGDMPILGPNCYGALNALDGVALWPDQHGLDPVDSGVAIIAQSSNIAINLTMQRRGLPIAYIITAGNQAQQSLADIAQQVLRDKRVTALGMYIESFGDIAAFEAMARLANDLNKPMVALKVGQSEESQKATISHTASLAGSSAGSDALLARLGIAKVSSPTALLETLKIYHVLGRLSGTRIASLSCSGGEASVMADLSHHYGLQFPTLRNEQTQQLSEHLSSLVHLSNPLDYHTQIWRNKPAMSAVFAAMTGEGIDITLIVLDFPRTDKCNIDEWIIAVGAIEQAAQQTGRPFGVITSMAENMPEAIAQRLLSAGIVPLCGFNSGLEAVAAAATQTIRTDLPTVASHLFSDTATLTERDAKSELATWGMDVPKSVGGLSIEEVAERAADLAFPIVLKGEGVAHKTEMGAVVLNLTDPSDVHEAAKNIQASSFLIEEMVTGAVAELLVGIVADPAHGFVLTLAAGGTLTELLSDRQSLLVPASAESIQQALARLKINMLLTGYRGAKPARVSIIVDRILQLQNYVIDHADQIAEIEINPLICTPDRAVIADALLVKGTS